MQQVDLSCHTQSVAGYEYQYHLSAILFQILDTNDEPMAIRFESSGVYENATEGTVVGKLITDDPDENQTHFYTLLHGKYLCKYLRENHYSLMCLILDHVCNIFCQSNFEAIAAILVFQSSAFCLAESSHPAIQADQGYII